MILLILHQRFPFVPWHMDGWNFQTRLVTLFQQYAGAQHSQW
jgi:hypothetical protein